MRTIPKAMALACLLTGAAIAEYGVGDGDGDGKAEQSAADLLDDANDTMSALSSVTVQLTNTAAGGTVSSRVRTDLKSRCTAKTTWADNGSLEQIRIEDTDYVRPDETYLKNWSGRTIAADRPKQWVKVPADRAQPGDGLTECSWPFASFAKATKGEATRIGDRDAVALRVTDAADKEGAYTFYVAAEGKPYLLKTVYKGGGNVTTTSFSAFDRPLDIQPPTSAGVVDRGDPED